MDKPKPGELEGIALRFSQTGLAGHNDPNTIMLADIIRRLSALEKMIARSEAPDLSEQEKGMSNGNRGSLGSA